MATEPEDELAGTEQPFVAHLVELRDRLIKAIIAIGIAAAILAVYPGPSAMYDMLAAPLVFLLQDRAIDDAASTTSTATGTSVSSGGDHSCDASRQTIR